MTPIYETPPWRNDLTDALGYFTAVNIIITIQPGEGVAGITTSTITCVSA